MGQNAVLVIANGTGTILVLEGWQFVSERVKAGGMWDDPDDKRLGRYLYKLNLEPEWTDQLQQLQELYTSSQPSRESFKPRTDQCIRYLFADQKKTPT